MSVGYYLISCGWHHPLDSSRNCQEKAESKQAGRLDTFIPFWAALWLWCEQLPWLPQNEELSPGIWEPKKTLSSPKVLWSECCIPTTEIKLETSILVQISFYQGPSYFLFTAGDEMAQSIRAKLATAELHKYLWYSHRTNFFFFLIKDSAIPANV